MLVCRVCSLQAPGLPDYLSHTWPLIAFVSRGLRGSGQWPHTGTSGTLWSRRKADSYQPRWFTSPQCFVDINLVLVIDPLFCFNVFYFILYTSKSLLYPYPSPVEPYSYSTGISSNRSLMLKYTVLLMASMLHGQIDERGNLYLMVWPD